MYQSWESYSRPRATDNVFRILALFVASFFVQWLASTFFYGPKANFQLASQTTLQFSQNFEIWQLFTHPFFHPSTALPWALLELLFGGLVLYFFGSELERTWGSHNFLKYFLSGILGAILFGLFVSFIPGQSYMYYGLAGGNAAVLTAYAMFWPDRQILFMFFIPMKMKWFILILFALLALPGGGAKLVQYSGGALAGAFFLYYYARKGGGYSVYAKEGLFTRTISGLRGRWEQHKRKHRLQAKQEEIERRIAIKTKVDHLLDKISKEGMDSLSSKEKKFLDAASKEI